MPLQNYFFDLSQAVNSVYFLLKLSNTACEIELIYIIIKFNHESRLIIFS